MNMKMNENILRPSSLSTCIDLDHIKNANCCKTLADCDLCDLRFPRNSSLWVHIEFYSVLETTIINYKSIVLHEQKLYVLPEWVL